LVLAVFTFLGWKSADILTIPGSAITGGEGFFAYVYPIVLGTLMAAVIARHTPGAVDDRGDGREQVDHVADRLGDLGRGEV
jgi:hypothetical protein